eukprot:Nk52_evm2s376 gene=Nk52_evmTU2s376
MGRVLVIGLGGATSSGKTTLAKQLLKRFRRCVIVHQDDYYREEEELPVVNGVANWEDPAGLRLGDFYDDIGRNKRECEDGERRNSGGGGAEEAEEGEEMYSEVQLLVVEGFLLYEDIARADEVLDLKFLILLSREECERRRDGREYLDGEYVDPPGYFSEFVWPHQQASTGRIRAAVQEGKLHGMCELDGESSKQHLLEQVEERIREWYVGKNNKQGVQQ